MPLYIHITKTSLQLHLMTIPIQRVCLTRFVPVVMESMSLFLYISAVCKSLELYMRGMEYRAVLEIVIET